MFDGMALGMALLVCLPVSTPFQATLTYFNKY